MACVCGWYKAHSNWLILANYSPVKTKVAIMGLQKQTNKTRGHIIGKLLTSTVWSPWESQTSALLH